MKTLAFLLATALVCLAAIAISQHGKLASQDSQLVALRKAAEDGSNQLSNVETERQNWRQERQDLVGQIADLTAQAQAARAPATNTVAAVPPPAPVENASPGDAPSTNSASGKRDAAGFGKMLSSMMKDPEMRKVIRSQQRVMMDQLYTPLIKRLGLSAEDGEKFKDTLADGMVSGADKASSLFDGGSATNRAELMKAMQADQKSADDKLKEFLGDDRYAQYKDYQKSASERMMLNSFRQQSGSEFPVTDQQAEQLLAFMQEEKDAAAANGQPVSNSGLRQANFDAMFTEEQMEKTLQSQETVNQRVYQRAQTVLSPDQLDAFGKFQKNQLQMTRMGMSMARKMFGTDSSSSTPAPSPGP